MSSVYQNNNGDWVASKRLGKDSFGKSIRPTFYGKTRKEAEDKLNTFLYEYKTGEYVKPTRDTLISFLNDYYDACQSKWEDTTKELYRMYIDTHFAPYFKDMKLIDVKPLVLDKYYNYKLSVKREITVKVKNKPVKKFIDPLGINSVRKLNTFLKAAFNYAIKNGMLKFNPSNSVELGKQVKYEPQVYNENQFMALLDAVSGTDDEIPIILGAGCGLRRGEIFGLYWRNINLNNKTITIEKTKVRFNKYREKKPKTETSKRTITVPGYVISALRLYQIRSKHTAPDDKVITQWKPGAYSERFGNLLEKYGLKHIRLHDLRHYNAVIMMKNGIPDKVAADRLGHANVSTLRKVYQHVLQDMDQTAADEIDKMFEKKNSQEARHA